jgi:hypothetical protein
MERMLEKLYDQLDRPGNRLTPAQFFQLPETAQLLDRQVGALADRVPPGSQIVNQTPSKITYRDAQGYETTLTRKPDGQVTEMSNRPAIVPSATQQGQQAFAQQLQGQLQQGLSQPAALAQLDPETARALQAISAAEQAALNQGISDQQGQLLAGLYGRGVNRSSIANNAAAQFAARTAAVRQQQSADAANREIAVRNFLTGLGQQNQALSADLYANLTGQQNQRDIAGAGLDIDLKRLAETSRQFNAANYLDTLRTQLERERLDAENGPLNKVLKISQAAANFAGAAGGGISAYDALRRRF